MTGESKENMDYYEKQVGKYVSEDGSMRIDTKKNADATMNTAAMEGMFRERQVPDFEKQVDEVAKTEITKAETMSPYLGALTRALEADTEEEAMQYLRDARTQRSDISGAYDRIQSRANKQKIEDLRAQINNPK
jgi:hypothetical protein